MYRCLFYVHDACWWNASITEFLRCCAVVRAPITLAPKILALTQDRIGAAGPPHAPREEPLSEERSDLRSAGGFLDEESVICNHRFGTNLPKIPRCRSNCGNSDPRLQMEVLSVMKRSPLPANGLTRPTRYHVNRGMGRPAGTEEVKTRFISLPDL